MHFSKRYFLAGVAALVLVSCGKPEAEKSQIPGKEKIPVQVSPIERVEAGQSLHAGGLLGTETDARLSFKTGGVIRNIFVKVGDPVHRGQVLATLDLTEINSGVNQARLALEKAQRDYDRVQALYQDSVATLEMLQNAKTGLDYAQQVVNAAGFNQQFSEIRATADGFVLARLMNEGEMAGPGLPILVLSTTSGSSRWVLRAGLADSDWSRVQEGDSASVTLDAYPGQKLKGFVLRKSLGADPYSGSLQVEIAVELGNLKPAAGLFGEADIFPAAHSQFWMLPYEAVLEANGSAGFVFITRDNQTARKVPVTIAYLDRDKIAVSGGLEGVTQVITSGSAYLTDGSSITLVK